MKKEKTIYQLIRYDGEVIHAKREIPYDIKLSSRLILDELCFKWNKHKLLKQIDEALEEGDRNKFARLSEAYNQYIWE
ncbi:MAG TPA: IDEAL domain-containing protein [Bacillota bacterium]|nr:IDEAL domain-containing protein [Bacillota bacterium]